MAEWFEEPYPFQLKETEDGLFYQGVGTKDKYEEIQADEISEAITHIVDSNENIKGIRIYYGKIIGDLDIEDIDLIEIVKVKSFTKYRGEYEVDYYKIPIMELIFMNTVFDDNVCFRNTIFEGEIIDFSSTIFKGKADFHNVKFEEDVIYFSSTIFEGRAYFHNAKFEGDVIDLNSIKFDGEIVDFSSIEFDGEIVDFSSTIFGGGKIHFNDELEGKPSFGFEFSIEDKSLPFWLYWTIYLLITINIIFIMSIFIDFPDGGDSLSFLGYICILIPLIIPLPIMLIINNKLTTGFFQVLSGIKLLRHLLLLMLSMIIISIPLLAIICWKLLLVSGAFLIGILVIIQIVLRLAGDKSKITDPPP